MNLIKKYENPRVLTRYEVNQLIKEVENPEVNSVECGNTIVRKDGEFVEVITVAKSELWK